MTDSVDGRGDAYGDPSRLFSSDGTIGPDLARILTEQLSGDHGNGRVPDPRTEALGACPEPDLSGFVGLVPVAPEDAFPDTSLTSLKTGLGQPQIDLVRDRLEGGAPSESAAPGGAGDPAYYFAPSPPAQSQDAGSIPAPAKTTAPVVPDPTAATLSSLKTGFGRPEIEVALGHLGGDAPTASASPAHPGDPGYYFAPSPPAHTQEVTTAPAPADAAMPAGADPASSATMTQVAWPEIELGLGQLEGDAPAGSAMPTLPGDPGYYFIPSPPAHTQEVTSPPAEGSDPTAADPTSSAAAQAGVGEPEVDQALGQGQGYAPTQSGAPTHGGDSGAYFAPSPPAPGQQIPSSSASGPPAADTLSAALASLQPGLDWPEVGPALGQREGELPAESSPQGTPEDPGYYFVSPPAPPAPAEEEATSTPPAQASPLSAPAGADAFNAEAVRRDFPILEQKVHGQPLVWFDNAATTQKPQTVIDRIAEYYATENSNVHRGAHTLAARATEAYEGARETVRRFLGAGSTSEIIFVRGTTEAVNLVAQSLGGTTLGPGDEILLTTLEHHSNIVPWQFVAAETGANLRVAPISESGEILLEQYGQLLGARTKIVAMTHVSNALGTIVPVREMTDMAHRAGARVLIDGAQAVAHFPVDVQSLDADFYALSAHKLFGPTGVGVLYGKRDVLEEMPPWQGGGSMIDDVTFERTTYAGLPQKFEAGTPIIAGAVGLAAAIDYLERLGLENVARYERVLTEYTTAALDTVPGLVQIGTAREKVGVFSFVMEGIPTEQLGRHLDQYGIAVRAGHHCAQPTMRRYGVEATVRPSLALYNTFGEVDLLVEALKRARTAIR